MKAAIVIKAAAIFMVCLAVGMLAINFLGRAVIRPPKVAILCPPDPTVTEQVVKSLAARGLLKDADYRLEAFPCKAPNTYRQAAVSSVGSEAEIFVAFDPNVLPELNAANRTAMVVDPEKFTEAMTELAEKLKRRP